MQHSDDRGFVVIVGVDGSEDARTAAEWALHEAISHRGRLVIAHAWSLPALATGPGAFSNIRLDDLQSSAEQLVAAEESHLRATGSTVEIDTRLEYGSPIAVLLDLAVDAGLVVVGSRGVGRVAGLLLGSVSQAIVGRASCPVLVVPPTAGSPA